MYGDTTVMRRHASQLRDQGTDLRSMADHLVGQVDAIGWSGRAAADLRSRIEERAALLRDSASAHDGAADALTKHLRTVDELKEQIADVERRAASLVADARQRIARLPRAEGVVVEATDADRQLDQFTPPPSGHKDWLAVSLPGL